MSSDITGMIDILSHPPALNSLRRAQLVQLCAKFDLKTYGKNEELVLRLQEFGANLPPHLQASGSRPSVSLSSRILNTPIGKPSNSLMMQTPEAQCRPVDGWEVLTDSRGSFASRNEGAENSLGLSKHETWKSAQNGESLVDFGSTGNRASFEGLRRSRSSMKALASTLSIRRRGNPLSPIHIVQNDLFLNSLQAGADDIDSERSPSPVPTIGVPKRHPYLNGVAPTGSTIRLVSSTTDLLQSGSQGGGAPAMSFASIRQISSDNSPNYRRLPPLKPFYRYPEAGSPLKSKERLNDMEKEHKESRIIDVKTTTMALDETGVQYSSVLPKTASSQFCIPSIYPSLNDDRDAHARIPGAFPEISAASTSAQPRSFIFGSGDAVSNDQFKSASRKLFEGVIVQSKASALDQGEEPNRKKTLMEKINEINRIGEGKGPLVDKPKGRFDDAHAREFAKMAPITTHWSLKRSNTTTKSGGPSAPPANKAQKRKAEDYDSSAGANGASGVQSIGRVLAEAQTGNSRSKVIKTQEGDVGKGKATDKWEASPVNVRENGRVGGGRFGIISSTANRIRQRLVGGISPPLARELPATSALKPQSVTRSATTTGRPGLPRVQTRMASGTPGPSHLPSRMKAQSRSAMSMPRPRSNLDLAKELRHSKSSIGLPHPKQNFHETAAALRKSSRQAPPAPAYQSHSIGSANAGTRLQAPTSASLARMKPTAINAKIERVGLGPVEVLRSSAEKASSDTYGPQGASGGFTFGGIPQDSPSTTFAAVASSSQATTSRIPPHASKAAAMRKPHTTSPRPQLRARAAHSHQLASSLKHKTSIADLSMALKQQMAAEKSRRVAETKQLNELIDRLSPDKALGAW